MKKRVLLFVLGCVFFASGTLTTSAVGADKKSITIGTWGTGDASYFLAGAISRILNAKVPQVNSVVIPASTVKVTLGFESGEIMMGWTQSEALHFAPKGEGGGPFKKGEVYKKGRVLLYLSPSPMHAVVLDKSKIKTVTDFNKNTRIAVFSPASLSTAQVPLRYHGVKDDQYKLQYLDKTAQCEALKDGNIDVMFQSGNFPMTAIQQVAREVKIRILPWDSERIKKAVRENPNFVSRVIPKDSYGTGIPDRDILSMGTLITLGASADLDEKMAYDIVKAILENVNDIIAVHADGKLFTAENTQYWINQLVEQFPFHPGAKRYLKEKGVKFKD
jgi:uncharacterized protein